MINRAISYFDDPNNNNDEIGVEVALNATNEAFINAVDTSISLNDYTKLLDDAGIAWTLNPNPKKRPHIH